jgi:APA family basic amino acid/polyamine antiporter
MSLYREIGLSAAVFLVIGNIVGIGIFITSGLIIDLISSSPWLIGIWILGGFLALTGAICYGRLGILFPKAGGEYAFLRPTYGPLPAFLSGWSSLVIGFTAPIAASALGLAHYLSPYLPGYLSDSGIGRNLVAAATLLVVSMIISIGLKAGNRMHSIITVVNLFLIAGFSLAVIYRAPTETYLVPALQGSWTDVGLQSLAPAIVMVMFTYSGWNAAAYIAEEIKQPEKNLPLSLLIGTIIVISIYVLINTAYLSGASLESLKGNEAVAQIVSGSVFGPSGQNIVNFLIILSIMTSLTAMSIAGPRVYFAMARDRLLPNWFSEVDPKKKIPLKAIWFQTALAILLVMVGQLSQILIYAGVILISFSTLTVSALFKVSKMRVLPSIFISVNVVILIYAAVSKPVESMVGLVTVALGLPVYWYYERNSKASPIRNAPEDISS